jgi:hypothetical protein
LNSNESENEKKTDDATASVSSAFYRFELKKRRKAKEEMPEETFQGTVSMRSSVNAHIQIACELCVNVLLITLVEIASTEVNNNSSPTKREGGNKVSDKQGVEQAVVPKRRKLKIKWKEIGDILSLKNEAGEIETVVLVLLGGHTIKSIRYSKISFNYYISGYYIRHVKCGMTYFHVLVAGFWETHLIQRIMKMDNFQTGASSEDCLNYYLETIKYLRYGDETDPQKSIEKFLDVLSDFSSEVIINMKLKTITLSNIDLFAILLNIINLISGRKDTTLNTKIVIDKSWEALFPVNTEIGKTNLGKSEEIQKALLEVVNNRLEVIEKCLEVRLQYLYVFFFYFVNLLPFNRRCMLFSLEAN